MIRPNIAQCSNCGEINAAHISMYCSEKPQKILRCSNEKCWGADDHCQTCPKLHQPLIVLSQFDQIHETIIRLRVSTERESIKSFGPGSPEPVVGLRGMRVRSTIAEAILFEWKNNKNFEIYGPKTMNFRLLIAIRRSIVARIDVGIIENNFTLFDAHLSIENAHEASQIEQTITILSFEEDEKIEIETMNYVYHLQFQKRDEVYGGYALDRFEQIQKN